MGVFMKPMDLAWALLKQDRAVQLGQSIVEAQQAARSRADPYSQPKETKGTPYFRGGKRSIVLPHQFGLPQLINLTSQQQRILDRRPYGRGFSTYIDPDDTSNPFMNP
jgi:hypothetical protein